jgi:hypothetical protein
MAHDRARQWTDKALVKLDDHRTGKRRLPKDELEKLAREGVAHVLRLTHTQEPR